MDSPVAVVGGSGRVGRLIVQQLLGRGERVSVIGRATPDGLPAGAVFHQGDVREPESLAGPLARCSAIVFCVEPGTDERGPDRPEATMHLGVCNVLAAAQAAGGRPHVVLVSQHHVTHHGHPLNAYGRVLDWRLAGEDAVRSSGLPYTVIRPGWLTQGPVAGRGVRLEQGDRADGRVSREDLAQACVQSLYCPSASAVTFEIFNESGTAPSGWEEMFSALEWDPASVG
ncbi:uncharacterized protein YbjT (DUF2867 family) [Streptacidiphilus sp. MAP12-16]|uniref:SDR family oxidoreductase n=1 Tax=Streptacidiphilus sp. MAP12-16 TaxID=3156300 RepID=UPI003514ADF4